jgi:LemA protein
MKANKLLLGLGGAVLVIGMWLMGMYNGLVAKDQVVDSQWAQVETQYQRRFDLIPGLVASTKGIFKQEQEVFGNIAEARQGYSGANTQEERVDAANNLESALSRLLVIVENYPQLQSNQTVLALMDELAGSENRVSVERKRYNDVARDYNTQIKTFPTMLLAGMFGFDVKPYFESTQGADLAPQVDLSIGDKEESDTQ